MDNSKAKTLIEKYRSGTINQAEMYLLDDWYATLATTRKLNLKDGELHRNLDDIWETIRLNTVAPKKTSSSLVWWSRIAAAALVLLIASVTLYFYLKNQPQNKLVTEKHPIPAIKSGGNQATLTLANGKTITLNDVANGNLAEQAGIAISKTKDGQLVYTINDKGVDENASQYINTIATPKGGQYQVILPDGTKVWLNAASSLRYPAHFSGKARKVTLSGEAYFEVSKALDKAKLTNIPFIVETEQQEVEVLGTHFNINAYTDEPGVKTTLLEGAVRVGPSGHPNKSVVLKPGEQSYLNENTLKTSAVNTDEAVAWKNGLFMFKDADLKTVMRAIARWYDVEVSYQGVIPKREFSGEMYRNLNLNQILDVLSFYKVNFRIAGKKIIVNAN